MGALAAAAPDLGPDGITVTGQKYKPPEVESAPIMGALAAAAPDLGPDGITVLGKRIPPTVLNATPIPLGAGIAGLAGVGAIGLGSLGGSALPAKPPVSTLDKIRAGLSLAGLAGSAFGGGGGAGGANGTGGAGLAVQPTIDPIFGAQLPAAGASFAGNSLSARNMSGTDWKRYGFGPSLSFFESSQPRVVPLAVQPPPAAPLAVQPPLAVPDAMILPDRQNFAQGGEVVGAMGDPRREFAVHGAGSGREDAIDAKLSDGEYVIDAETVALLGDGSNRHGAQQLDRFRVNLRKAKGKNLARGEFSVKAKRPEAYMAGGRK